MIETRKVERGIPEIMIFTILLALASNRLAVTSLAGIELVMQLKSIILCLQRCLHQFSP